MEKKNLLIVDDSRISRMVVRRIVEALRPNMNILEAESGKETTKVIENNSVDAVLLDHGMPDELGLDLAARLKDQNADLIIYMLTANIQEDMKTRADDLGIGFLEKPPTEEKLQTFLNDSGL